MRQYHNIVVSAKKNPRPVIAAWKIGLLMTSIAMTFLPANSLLAQKYAWVEDQTFLNPSGVPTSMKWAWGDIDLDGTTDIISLVWDSDVCCQPSVYTASGQTAPYWKFNPTLTEQISREISPWLVALADVKGDSLPEIVFAAYDFQTGKLGFVLLQRENPENWVYDWQTFREFEPDARPYIEQFSLADVDDDGDIDLLLGTESYAFGSGDLRFFENTGTRAAPFWKEDSLKLDQIYQNPPGYYTYSPAFADVNHDGIQDILLPYVIEAAGFVSYCAGAVDSSGVHWLKPEFDLRFYSLQSPTAFDFNEDGLQDILDPRYARLYLANDDNSLFDRDVYSLSLNDHFGAVTLPVNFNGDANLEILTIQPEYDGFDDYLAFRLFETDDAPGRTVWRKNEIRLSYTILPRLHPFARIADLDNNGVPEVVGSVDTVYLGEHTLFAVEYIDPAEKKPWPDKSFLLDPFINTMNRQDTLYSIPVFADLDHDADVDLLIWRKILTGADSGKSGHVFFENRITSDSIRWQERPDWQTGFSTTEFQLPAFADLDQDGDIDLVSGVARNELLFHENIGNSDKPVWRLREGVTPRLPQISSGKFENALPNPVFGDFDFDGDQDLFVKAHGIVRLFRNETITGAKNLGQSPVAGLILHQNYPNPFNAGTTIEYTLSETGFVTLEIIDLAGRIVRTLVNGRKLAGRHRVFLDTTHLAGGVYFYKIQNGKVRQTRKLVLLK